LDKISLNLKYVWSLDSITSVSQWAHLWPERWVPGVIYTEDIRREDKIR